MMRSAERTSGLVEVPVQAAAWQDKVELLKDASALTVQDPAALEPIAHGDVLADTLTAFSGATSPMLCRKWSDFVAIDPALLCPFRKKEFCANFLATLREHLAGTGLGFWDGQDETVRPTRR